MPKYEVRCTSGLLFSGRDHFPTHYPIFEDREKAIQAAQAYNRERVSSQSSFCVVFKDDLPHWPTSQAELIVED